MIKLSSKCMYAIRAMFDIAYHGQGGPVCGKDIADREHVPPRFLEQILLELKHAGLVHSKRGPSGGYALTRPPEEIPLLDVVQAIDGAIKTGCCDLPDDDPKAPPAPTISKCVAASIWRDVAAVLHEKLSAISVADLVRRGQELGVCKGNDQPTFYVI
jgi:Rrf2 family protein